MLHHSPRQFQPKTFTSNYEQWLRRVQMIQKAYRDGNISEEHLKFYQLYILDFGHYNANYTLEELSRLSYPKSPFANMYRHTYLRGTESWPVEILRQWHQFDFNNKSQKNTNSRQCGANVYPVFLDSESFWSECKHYCVVINAAELHQPRFSSTRKPASNMQEARVDETKWYRDNDISEYVDAIIDHDFNGYKDNDRYIINQCNESYNYQCVLEAVDVFEVAMEIDYNFNYTKQPLPVSVDNRKDIFHVLFKNSDSLTDKVNAKVQILFPYNITQSHWLTCEITIDKNDSKYNIVMCAHDPYGKGKVKKENFEKLCKSIEERIHECDEGSVCEFFNEESIYGARQDKNDSVSCGVIVARDIIQRLYNNGLNVKSTFPVGAQEERLRQLKEMMDINPNSSFVKRNCLSSNQDYIPMMRDLEHQIWVQLDKAESKPDAEEELRTNLLSGVIDNDELTQVLNNLNSKSNKLQSEDKEKLDKFF